MKNEGKNKRILFAGRYNPSEILSGPEKVAKRIFHEHIKHNGSIFIQYFFDGRKYNYFKKIFGKKIVYRENDSFVVTLGLIRILFEILKYKPDIIHFVTFERFSIILFLYKFFGKTKYFYNMHGIVTFENKAKKLPFFYRVKDNFCEKFFYKHSDIIVFPSEKYAGMAHKFHHFNDDKVRIIPHGCDTEFSNISHAQPDNNHLNLAIQIYMTYKIGFYDSLDSLKKILEKINFKINLFVICNSVISFNIDNSSLNVIYKHLMDTKEFAIFLGGINLFLSMNKYDPFSLTALEAMVAGAIPIVTEETGMSSYITNGINGYKASFGDEKFFLKTIEYLSGNKDKIIELSNNARKIYSELNWENIYNMYFQLYQKNS